MVNHETHYEEIVRNKPYDISLLSSKSINVKFHDTVYALAFFQHGYELQSLFEKRQFISESTGSAQSVDYYNTIIIDLSEIKWFDTLALCYLFLFLYDAKDNYGEKQIINFILPKDQVIMSFLVDNGFFRHIALLDDRFSKMDIEAWKDQDYSEIHSGFIPFTVINSREEITSNIDLVISKMEYEFQRYIDSERLSHLVDKVSYFISETLKNVYDHAYLKQTGRCGILIKNVQCYESINYKQYNETYTSKTPYIDIKLFEDSEAFLEVYIVDTGCGLKKSFDPDSDLSDINILQVIFEEGQRSHIKTKNVEATRYGGLHDIRELFNEDADGLGIKGDSVWKYVYKFNYDWKSESRINTIARYDELDKLIHGFALVASIHLPKEQSEKANDEKFFLNLPSNTSDYLFGQEELYGKLINTAAVIDERWDRVITPTWGTKQDSCVIYPPSITTKNWIESKIYSCAYKYLFFLEVYDAEIEKYKTNISGIKNSATLADYIFIVTKSLKVLCYVKGLSYFENSEKFANTFVETELSKSTKVSQSYSALLYFDRLYNSWRFWDFALLPKYRAYINEPVLWSQGIELKGYLDFSQIIRIPECRDICIQKLRELQALKHGVYFKSVDRFVDEICGRANYLVKGERDGKHLFVGSVFVSGKSNRLINNQHDCCYFLCHPNSESHNIKTLLLWANKDMLPPLAYPKQSEQFLMRVGSSSFIARGGADYWLHQHYDGRFDSFKLDNSTLYTLLQRQIGIRPRNVNLVHIENTERHDLISYRVDNWFNSDAVDRQLTSIYDRESVFDYLMTNVFFSLYGKISKEEFYAHLNSSIPAGKQNALWTKYYKADNKPKKRITGIIVYFYDFQTSMIVEKMGQYLSNDTTERFIPLMPLSRNYEMGSLVVSPLILSRIKEIMQSEDSADEGIIVTVFDAVVYNVRLLEEVKQILYGIGASKVKVLTVLDRRRFPIIETQPKILSLGRVDTPALHRYNRCSICSAIEKLNIIEKQIMNADLKCRLTDIISRWLCIQPSDHDYSKGLHPSRIALSPSATSTIVKYCEQYWGAPLEIKLDSALCSLVAEYTEMSTSAQLLLDLLNDSDLLLIDESRISIEELKIQLASTYLLLFSNNPISSKEIVQVAEKLIEFLDNENRTSQYSSFAVIAIASLHEKYINYLCELLEKKETIDNPIATKTINFDALLIRILSYLSVSEHNAYFLLERRVRCLLRGEVSKLQCLYDVFMYSEKDYKNSHRHAFARIIDYSSVALRDYQSALDYSRKLKAIIEEKRLFASLFHDKKVVDDHRNTVCQEIDDAIVKLENIVSLKNEEKDHLPLLEMVEENQISMLETSVKDSVNAFINHMIKLNTKNLYLRTPSIENTSDKTYILEWLHYCKSIAEFRCSEDVKDFCFEVNVKSAPYNAGNFRPWFYSYGDVTEEVINLMVDILHYRTGKIPNGNGDLYDGIIAVYFLDNYVEFRFVNKANNQNNSIDKIYSIKKSKSNRETLLVFRDFERQLFEEENEQVNCFDWKYVDWKSTLAFMAILRLPYINRGSANYQDVFERGRYYGV